MKSYVYYSPATDVTGNILKDKLKINGGQDAPAKDVDLLICWGAKTSKDITLPANMVVLNHPNAIRKNRNKFTALDLMKKSKVPVGAFVPSESILASIKNGSIKLPVIGRTNYHQGGKNFWTCLSKTHVEEAIKNGAQYFQEYVPIVKEYRMHVFEGNAFYISVKTKSDDPQKAFVAGHTDKIKATADKNGQALDAKTMEYTLGKIADRNQHANPILKSHTEGWVFKAVAQKDITTKPIQDLSKVAIDAVKAVGLNFGAVDCGLVEDGSVVVLEVNSGPGLEGTSLDKWLEQIAGYITKLAKPAAKAPAKTEATAAVKTGTFPKVEKAAGGSAREEAMRRTALLQEMLATATDDEASSIMSAASKMFAAEAKGAQAMYNKG